MHPLWGVIGPDPRNYDTAEGPVLLSACVNWIVDEVDDAFPRWRADSQSVNSTTIESSLRARAPRVMGFRFVALGSRRSSRNPFSLRIRNRIR